MNIRQSITRNVTYTEVTVSYEGEHYDYIVHGVTSEAKEMKKILREKQLETIPEINCKTITEKRAISLENFINNSIVINESGDQ